MKKTGFGILFLLLAVSMSDARAAAFVWIGADGGSWEAMANWTQDGNPANRLPQKTDDVVLSVPQNQNRKKVLLGGPKTGNDGVKTLTVENISLEPDTTAGVRDVVIEVQGNATLDAKAQVIAAANGAGNGGRVALTSITGGLTIEGNIVAGNGGTAGTADGKGGRIELQAKDTISLKATGSLTAGASVNGANNSHEAGGKIEVSSDGNIEIKGAVSGGNDTGGGVGGAVRFASKNGTEILLDSVITAGDSASATANPRTGGGVFVLASKAGAELKLGAACRIKAGEGSFGQPPPKPGTGGVVSIASPKVTDAAGADVLAGKGGGNGGLGGSIVFVAPNPGDKPDLTLTNGTYKGGDGGNGAGGGKGGGVRQTAKSLVNGKNILAGTNGTLVVGTMGDVTGTFETTYTALPGVLVQGDRIAIISNGGGLMDLKALTSGAIRGQTSICLGDGSISSPSTTIDLRSNPAGSNVLVANPGGQITLRGVVLLNGGVTLADISEPDAIVSSAPCPCSSPPEEVPDVHVDAAHVLRWSPLPSVSSYAVVRGRLSMLPVGPGGADETCFSPLLQTSLSNPVVPPVGDGYWYLVKARSTCGTGTYGYEGTDEAPGNERLTSTCPP